MARIEYVTDGVQVDANILAQALAISAADLRLGMREGAITSRFERGEGKDVGKVRLTFFSPDRRVRMIADEQGSVLECSAADFPKQTPASPAASNGNWEAGAGDFGGGAADETPADLHVAKEIEDARRLDALLDEALRETFPASDPVAIDFDIGR